MIRFAALIGASAIALGACAPTGGQVVSIPEEAIVAFDGKTEEEIMTRVAPAAFIASFEKVCEANVDNLAGALALLKSDGYILLADSGDVTAYAHPDGKPVFGFGGRNPRKPEVCMVMSRNSANLRSVTEAYANKLPNVLEVPIAGLAPGAEKAWLPGDGAETLYLTVNRTDPSLGEIFAFAIGKI
ncbi:hypothetical protein IV417_11910 [Alphaproteobacteria bacterium KMM 3653]|uniref:Uncharacterized protein n=1 Tax=Harenicola maris TaxID=2841044 RepID=A0AAP2G4M8_9RHOB|nr:hypothetical protein [Harenicola maris]